MDSEDDHQLEEFIFLDKTSLETKLICNICERHLNVTPIGFNEDVGSICGRCISGTTLNGFGAILRQHSLEVLIEHLTFPCTNKSYGCTEVLRFDEVQLHEKNCRFQCTNCPLFYTQLFPEEKCSWNGNTNNLYKHLRTHKDKFLDPPQFDWPEGEQNKIFFTTVGNDIITVMIKHESATKFVCLAVMNSTDLESQCFRYQLELADETKTNSIILRRNRLQPFSNFIESLQQPEKTLEVDIKNISEMLQNPKKVCVRFGIAKKSKKEIVQLTGIKDSDILSSSTKVDANKEENLSPDEELLMELECPVCNEFMVPPIFICATGHSVCSDCRCKVIECPSCRRPFGDGRNFTLEKLTRRVKYPCKNRDIGCGYVNTSNKIKQHERACELSENSCILKCGWKGLTQGLYNHILEKHDQRIILNDNYVLGDAKTDKELIIYFLFVMDELFCLSIKNCSKMSIKFNIQHVGYGETSPKYKYTMQFTSTPNSVCPTLSLTNFCLPWNANVLNTLESDSVTIPRDLLKSYLFQDMFYYFKVNITEG